MLKNSNADLEKEIAEKTALIESKTSLEAKLNIFAEEKIAKFKEVYGDEKLTEIIGIVGEDKIVLSEKLSHFEKIL